MSSQAKVLQGLGAVAPTERPPPPPESLVGRMLDGRYRIDAKIGEGGLGTVYRAQHLKLDRAVAIKVLKADLRAIPDIRSRFEREVRMLAALSHPNVVTITDYGDTASLPYLVMELVEGDELSSLIGRISPQRALGVIRQILSSLAYAHKCDVVHRDLKPANVIVRALPDGSDYAVVLDFGLAKFVGDEGPGHDLTRSGLVVGTPAYLPPEQIGGGAKKSDARSDLYAVGLILFEMLTGRRPFITDDAAEMLRAHLVTIPPTLGEASPNARVSPALERLVARALEKAPNDRYASAKEMIDALDALGPHPMDGPSDPRDPTPPMSSLEIDVEPLRRAPPPPSQQSSPWWLPAGILGIAGAFGLGMLVAHETDPSVAPASTVSAEITAMVPDAVMPEGPIELPTVSRATGAASTAAHAVGAAVGGAMNDAVDEASAALAAIDAADLIESDGELDEAEAAEVALTEASEAEAPPDEGIIPSAEEGDLAEDPTEAVGFAVPATRPAARNPWAGRVPRQLVRLRTSQHRGGLNAGELRSLTRYRNEHPQDVRARLVLGHEYIRRGWLTVGLDQYERALSMDLACRMESDLLPALLRVARTEGLTARASNMIVAAYGSEAAPAVDRAITREHDDEARGRLQLLRARL